MQKMRLSREPILLKSDSKTEYGHDDREREIGWFDYTPTNFLHGKLIDLRVVDDPSYSANGMRPRISMDGAHPGRNRTQESRQPVVYIDSKGKGINGFHDFTCIIACIICYMIIHT